MIAGLSHKGEPFTKQSSLPQQHTQQIGDQIYDFNEPFNSMLEMFIHILKNHLTQKEALGLKTQ